MAVRRAEIETLHPALLSRVIVRLTGAAGAAGQSARTIEAIMDALEEEEAVVNLTGGAHALAGREYLSVVRAETPQIDVPLAMEGVTDTPFGCFTVRPALPEETGDGKTCQRVPARLLKGARVTGRREGDAMVPFGKRSPVKLKKLMIDAGIERAMRSSIPVLRTAEGNVFFAVGLRPSQLCMGTEDEKQMLVCFCGAWPQAETRQTNQTIGGYRDD